MYLPQGPHPNPQWLQSAIAQMSNSRWLQDNLDEILDKLHYYLDDTTYVLDASSVLDCCFKFAMDRSRYTELKYLHEITLDTFEGDDPITYRIDFDLPSWVNDHNHEGDSNKTRYPDEYFRLKLNLGHTALMMRNRDLATQQLADTASLMEKASLLNQLDACCVMLKFTSYGYQLENEATLVRKTEQLAHIYKRSSKMIDAYIAIAYYHYSQGNVKKIEQVLHKIMRAMSYALPESEEIHEITGEQHYYLSVIYREQEDFDKAQYHLDKASTHYGEIDNWERNMLILHETALWFALRDEDDPDPEDLERAQQWLNLAKREYHQLANPQIYHYGMLEHTQGLIHFHTKNYDLALEKFHSIIDIWEEHKHQYHMALTYNVIGYTHYVMEKYEEAIKYYEEAEEICEPLPEGHSKRLLKTIQEHLENARNFLE